MITLLHCRPDGTFVVDRNGLPYHVTHDDPLFAEVAAAAQGVDLPPEPLPEVTPPPPRPQPTKAELMAEVQRLLAIVVALPD